MSCLRQYFCTLIDSFTLLHDEQTGPFNRHNLSVSDGARESAVSNASPEDVPLGRGLIHRTGHVGRVPLLAEHTLDQDVFQHCGRTWRSAVEHPDFCVLPYNRCLFRSWHASLETSDIELAGAGIVALREQLKAVFFASFVSNRG